MNSSQAKQLNLPDLMGRLGYEPISIKKEGKEYWYLSPFRKEKDASFHTSYLGGKWIWNDFGDRGGTVIDFVMRHENYHSVSDALLFLDKFFNKKTISVTSSAKKVKNRQFPPSTEKTLRLEKVKALKSNSLVEYLTKDRVINFSIANLYLKEIHFTNTENQKLYFALGMENMSGGYEIRNPFFKSSLGKKDITIVHGQDRGEVSIFEGYLDFLSYLTDQNKSKLKGDVLILNSIVFSEKAANLILAQSYSKVFTFFDNDKKGAETLAFFQKFPITIISCNHLYSNHKDYNQFLQQKKK